jgi:transposase
MSALVCGLDVHKDSTYATILDSEGKIVSQRRMSNETVLSYLSSYSVDRIGMESSNQVAPLYRTLTKNGYAVSVSHPKKTRYIAEAKIKSDRVDSKAIAELVRLNALPPAYMPDEETAILREKIRRRAFLVRERVRLRVKIKSILTYEGIKPQIDHGLFTELGVEWLHSLALEPVESYLRIIKTLDNEIKQLSKHLKELAENDDDIRLLMTIPGVGYYTALLVKSEIGDINRFSDGDRLCSYGGLVPSTHASGGIIRHGSITKEGSRWLRWVMVEAAMTHVHKYDTAITKAYHRIAERRGKQVATVAAARKLLLCCYAVLRNRHPYYDQA